jgi:large subunit ribosomal protein L21
MYAIVETGGKQYRVKPGDTIAVERLGGEPGDVLDLGRVLLVAGNGDASTRVGSPGVDGAVVRAEVVEHGRGEKIIVFRYKSKVRYRRKTGHRQSLTRVRITDILLDGASTASRATTTESAAPAEPEQAPAVAAETTLIVETTKAVEATSAPTAAAEIPSSAGRQPTPAVVAETTPTLEAESTPTTAGVAETTPSVEPETAAPAKAEANEAAADQNQA